MFRDNPRLKLTSRRAALLGAGQLLLCGVLVGRMYQLQVIDGGHYRKIAEENRISHRFIAPVRGRIYDRHRRPLAVNNDNYRVIMVVEKVGDVHSLLDSLSRIITLDHRDRSRVVREFHRRRPGIPVTIRENLDWRDVSRIEVNTRDLPGLSVQVGQARRYRNAKDFCHVLGYVAAVSEADFARDRTLRLPGLKIGRSGAERAYDGELRGKVGVREVEVTARGRIVRELARTEGTSGGDVRLTLESELQGLVVRRLSEHQSASAVILDIRTGDILSMVSVPGFDPNEFASGISHERWNHLSSDPLSPLLNKSIGGTYPPGSTFKMVVALAAMETGRIGADHRVKCEGHVEIGNTRLHCWNPFGHGEMDMLSAIEQSCDVYFYDLASRVGVDRIAQMAARLGLGLSTGLGLPAEKQGVIPTRAWKEKLFDEPWQLGETMVIGIGQGFVLCTPLQLAVMTARIANSREAVLPRLAWLGDGANSGRPGFRKLGISERSLQIIRRAMYRATNSPQGTAYNARILEDRYEMAGKTGTSQIRRISAEERRRGILKNEDRPWKERDHALYVGFAPAARPRYAVSVVVEHGGGGGSTAAPIARDLLLAAQTIDPVRGDGRKVERKEA